MFAFLRRAPFAFLLGLTLLAMLSTLAAAESPSATGPLEVYTLDISQDGQAKIEVLKAAGVDLLEAHGGGHSNIVQLVLSPQERVNLQNLGLSPVVWKNAKGQSATQMAARPEQGTFKVWRSYDEPGGIKDELYQIAKDHPDIVKLVVLGQSVQGREIIALKVTKDAATTPDGSRPAVLYSALQHAREWIALEVNRRLLHHFVDNYGKDELVNQMVNERELWFVVLCNPDGYQYTYTMGNRLWRKNMRDNNGDGRITGTDGVDPNRNFPNHWGYDNEGSSAAFGSETFRGTAPMSEPETQALTSLQQRIPFKFQVNYHSAAELLLYGLGWQMKTPSSDNPIFEALAGDDDKPAVPRYDPDLSADLYITNGETCDYAYGTLGILCMTPELSDGGSGGGFVFPDDEALVQKEFDENLPFALDIAKSAADLTHPVSHLGNTIQPMYADAFPVSYGNPQTVSVNAMRRLGPVALKYQVNGGAVQTGTTAEWPGGELFGDQGNVYYHPLRGQVTGTKPGDQVQVWFEARNEIEELVKTAPFTYGVASDSHSTVLVVANEDYKGAIPAYAKQDGPSYAQAYLDALKDNGVNADLYDVDGRGQLAPHPLGVLSHYKLVVWYSGDDYFTRNEPTGVNTKLPLDMQIAVRAFLNEGGKLIYAGPFAGYQTSIGALFHARTEWPCSATDQSQRMGCETFSNDFMQYYMGANGSIFRHGTNGADGLFPVLGSTRAITNGLPGVLDGLRLEFGKLRPTQPMTMATAPYLLQTSYGLVYQPISLQYPADAFPQFASRVIARYDHPGDRPKTGNGYLRATTGTAYAYRRLLRTINLTDTTQASLDFSVSRYDWYDWGNVFVEAHTPGQDDWTTLPDRNGHTKSEPNKSCGIFSGAGQFLARHPHLGHYLTRDITSTPAICLPSGSSGVWNAANGNSQDWEDWSVDLSKWSGKQVEVSISYLTGYNAVGAYFDDIAITGDNVAVVTGTLTTSFEGNTLEGWRSGGAPPGSPNAQGGFNLATATSASGAYPGGPILLTRNTVLMTFGLEQLGTGEARRQLMGRLMDYLAPRPKVYVPVLMMNFGGQ